MLLKEELVPVKVDSKKNRAFIHSLYNVFQVVIDLTFFPQLVNCPAFTKGAQTQYLR